MSGSLRLRTWCAALILGPSCLCAAPVQLNGVGVWTSVEPGGVVNLNGIGTNAITWGTPLDANASGYTFAGNAAVVDPLDGTVFRVGTFTHNNYLLSATPTPNSIIGATLQVAFDIQGSSSVSRAFTFHFLHSETLNADNPCPLPTPHLNPGGGGCEDVVKLETVFSEEAFDFEGSALKLEILGFLKNGVLVDQFLTNENASNSALLQARFTSDFPSPIPEPSTYLLMLGGLAAIGLVTRGRRKQQATPFRW